MRSNGQDRVHSKPSGPWWRVERLEMVPSKLEWLSPEEQRHLSRLQVDKRRRDWLLGRWTAKSALCRHPYLSSSALEPADLTIRPDADGAPEALLRNRRLPVCLSISHRAGWGLCVLAPEDMLAGCDLEVVESRSSGFLNDYYTEEEQAFLRSEPGPQMDRIATLFWAAKESALKALRLGLRADTRRIQIGMTSESRTFATWSGLSVQDAESEMPFGAWGRFLGELAAVVVTSPPSREPSRLVCGL
jgi:4'-phosphopantetheinyl transferase